MESIVEYLRRQLRAAGPGRWEAIGASCNVGAALLRKLAYGDRDNPRVLTVQPLLDYFGAVERGELSLPEEGPAAQQEVSDAA